MFSSKIHSSIQVICIMINHLQIFSRKFHSKEIDSSRNSENFSKLDFPKSSFPWFSLENILFLRFIFKRSLSSFLKNQNRFSNFSRLRFSRISSFLSFDFPSPKSFPINFNHFPKKIFKVRVFFSLTNIFLFKCSSFLKNSFHFPRIFIHSWFSQIFINFLEISNLFIRVSWEISFHLFFEKIFSNSKAFSEHTSCFPTYILQNFIAHAWILCAFRIEHDFDNLAKSSTHLVLGSITPVKGGRNGRTSYRQVEPHPMDFPANLKNGGEYFKTFSKLWSSLTRGNVFPSLPQGREEIFATITGLATVMGPVLVWSKVCLT